MTAARVVRLGPDDLATARAWNAMFGDVFGEPHTYAGNPPDDAWLRGLLSREDFIALAALDGDSVIGGLAAYVLTKFEQARKEVFCYDLAVAESHRRQGVATALIERVQDEAERAGAWVAFIQAERQDAPAVALYSKHGVMEEALHFDLPVPRRRRA